MVVILVLLGSMAYRRSRRYSRRRRSTSGRTSARSLRTISRTARNEEPVYSYGCPARSLVHFVPALNEVVQIANFTGDINNYHCFNGIAQGSGLDQRTGTKAYIRSLLIRGNVEIGSNAMLSDTSPRWDPICVMLVWDSNPDPAVPVAPVTDILDFASPMAPQRIDNRDRFKILFRRVTPVHAWPVNSTTYIIGPQSHRNVEWKIPINRITTWKQTGVSDYVGNITHGLLTMYTLSDLAYAAGLNTTLRFTYRLSFTDFT